jgi:hypothetical protein
MGRRDRHRCTRRGSRHCVEVQPTETGHIDFVLDDTLGIVHDEREWLICGTRTVIGVNSNSCATIRTSESPSRGGSM